MTAKPKDPKAASRAQQQPRSMLQALAASLLHMFVRSVAATPRWLMPIFGSALALLLRPFAARDMQRLRVNVKHIFGLPPGSHFARMFERQVFRHQIVCALETLKATFALRSVEISGEEELRERVAAAEATGKPHIFVTAHLGSWELCAYQCALSSRKPVQVLAKPPHVAAAKDVLDAMRQRMGVSVLWTGTKTLLRDMLSALRRGEALGFVMDQKPEGRQGPVVPFFGHPTPFVAGPAAMALKFDATVIALFCVREGPFRFRILSETIRVPGEGLSLVRAASNSSHAPSLAAEDPELALTARMAEAVETAIRAYPEQWTWSYKRWRFAELN